MSRVLWRDAQGVEGSLDLGPGEVMIGRAMDCAIRTDDAMVSRRHARIFFDGLAYVVEDLASANGIFYQEQRVPRHPLRHGDAVRCGSLWLRFVDTGEGGRAPASPVLPHHSAERNPRHPQVATRRPHHETDPVPLTDAKTGEPHSLAIGSPPALDHDEVRRLRRRVEQLESELRIYRGGGERAQQMEELEREVAQVTAERDHLKAQVGHLESTLAREGASVKVQRASSIARTAAEIVSELNDVLSNLRINVMAAEGEFDQFASAIPRASFELIREALRSSAADMETAREMLRKLREIAGS